MVIFHTPTAKMLENPDPDTIKSVILNPSDAYWNTGGAMIDFDGGQGRRRLLVTPHPQFGVYLKYIYGDQIWMSLSNKDDLLTTVDAADEWYVSRGLFVSPETAWLGIRDFMQTGERSKHIEWLSPSDIPEGGNW